MIIASLHTSSNTRQGRDLTNYLSGELLTLLHAINNWCRRTVLHSRYGISIVYSISNRFEYSTDVILPDPGYTVSVIIASLHTSLNTPQVRDFTYDLSCELLTLLHATNSWSCWGWCRRTVLHSRYGIRIVYSISNSFEYSTDVILPDPGYTVSVIIASLHTSLNTPQVRDFTYDLSC